jgi:hypothetical protein
MLSGPEGSRTPDLCPAEAFRADFPTCEDDPRGSLTSAFAVSMHPGLSRRITAYRGLDAAWT